MVFAIAISVVYDVVIGDDISTALVFIKLIYNSRACRGIGGSLSGGFAEIGFLRLEGAENTYR